METIVKQESVLNKFEGVRITREAFIEEMCSLEGQSVNVELVKGIITAQWYDDFSFVYNDKMMSFEDESEEMSPIAFKTKDIENIVKGECIYEDHWLIKLNNNLEIMVWVQ